MFYFLKKKKVERVNRYNLTQSYLRSPRLVPPKIGKQKLNCPYTKGTRKMRRGRDFNMSTFFRSVINGWPLKSSGLVATEQRDLEAKNRVPNLT